MGTALWYVFLRHFYYQDYFLVDIDAAYRAAFLTCITNAVVPFGYDVIPMGHPDGAGMAVHTHPPQADGCIEYLIKRRTAADSVERVGPAQWAGAPAIVGEEADVMPGVEEGAGQEGT